MAHLKVINNGIEPLPHIVIAETGDRVSGVSSVSYSHTCERGSELTIVIVEGQFEMAVEREVRRGGHVERDASDATP